MKGLNIKMDTQKLISIARYLKTRYEYKGHGGYMIYEDDKIEIFYDTYYPNVDVYVKLNGEKKLVLLRSGHGYDQEYHSGKWEEYVDEVLYPRALIAMKASELVKKEEEARKIQENFGVIDDSHIFTNERA